MSTKKLATLLLLVPGVLLASCAIAQDEEATAATETPAIEGDAGSYALGIDIARTLAGQGIEFDVDAFVAGLRDQMAGTPKLEGEALQAELTKLQTAVQAKQQARMAEQAETNIAEAETFLAENAKREGVQQTESGLQYEIVEDADGPKPSATDQVTVHYEGKLLDGTVFDSSRQRGQPATFPLDRVIPGWTEGLQLMSPGATYKFFIPPALAYGPTGAGNRIPPNAALVFEVELIEIGGEQEGQ